MALRISSQNNLIIFTDTATGVSYPYNSAWVEERYTDTEVYFEHMIQQPSKYPFRESYSKETLKFEFANVQDAAGVSLGSKSAIQTYLSDKLGIYSGSDVSLSNEVLFSGATSSLANGGELDSGWIDTAKFASYQISVFADAADLSLVIDSSEVDGGGGVSDRQTTTALLSSFLGTLPCRERYMRFRVVNSTGSAVTNVKFELKGEYNGTGASVFPAYVNPAQFSPAVLTRSIDSGQQPDGDYVNSKQDGQAFLTTSTLAADATYTSDWVDTDGWKTIELTVTSDVKSAVRGVIFDFTNDANVGSPTTIFSKQFNFSEVDVRRGYRDYRVTTALDGFRVRYINGDEGQGSFFLEATLRTAPEDGFFNEGNVQVTGEFLREVALGNISNYASDSKYGRNPDVDTGTAEDVISSGGTYTGFNATANENLQTISTSANDAGTLVSSGTATDGSTTTIVDTGATFVTDGVSVGDLVINDTQKVHGVITSVDSETQLTVFDWTDTVQGEFTCKSGDSYRVASAASTGAAVVRWNKILNANYEKQGATYVITNGLTGVTSTGDYYRCSRGRVVLAGSAGACVGVVSARQATTTANVFATIQAGDTNTFIACDTVPKDAVYLLETTSTAISRANGAAGSAVVSLRARQYGEVFNQVRVFEPVVGAKDDRDFNGGIVFNTGTDIKFRVDSVSDNNTSCTAEFEYLEIDL